MRLWSIHPCYLDTKGLLAAWREGLLAQKVLQGKTKGYKNHPQLERFKQQTDPVAAMGRYLGFIVKEAERRGYDFKKDKIVRRGKRAFIKVSRKQLSFEFMHLKRKLKARDLPRYRKISSAKRIVPHPSFKVINGEIADWERP